MENIVATVDDKGIALLELNRPDSLNAMTVELVREMTTALEELAPDESVKALIITGRGRAFCAGADLGGGILHGEKEGASIGASVAEAMEQAFNPMMETIYAFPRPVISAVNGIAAGGGAGLALCADIVVAAESSALKVVQVQQLGIVADLGANWLLERIAGRGRAMAMCLLADTVPASTLKEWGLVWECTAADSLMERARFYAEKLAVVPAATVLATRKLVDEATGRSFVQSLEDERLCQRQLCDEPVFIESVKRFMGMV